MVVAVVVFGSLAAAFVADVVAEKRGAYSGRVKAAKPSRFYSRFAV